MSSFISLDNLLCQLVDHAPDVPPCSFCKAVNDLEPYAQSTCTHTACHSLHWSSHVFHCSSSAPTDLFQSLLVRHRLQPYPLCQCWLLPFWSQKLCHRVQWSLSLESIGATLWPQSSPVASLVPNNRTENNYTTRYGWMRGRRFFCRNEHL